MSTTPENRFAVNRTVSNQSGVTLMNNQVGYVVANVMRGKPDVTVTELPSMIRVDGVGRVDFDYEEIAEALGWDDFGNDDFEEIMSTHYGRMVASAQLDILGPGNALGHEATGFHVDVSVLRAVQN